MRKYLAKCQENNCLYFVDIYYKYQIIDNQQQHQFYVSVLVVTLLRTCARP